jgi:hypothetical protein
MQLLSRRAMLAGLTLGAGLPFIGCGGEPLKGSPEGSGPPPASQAEWQQQELERAKATKAAAKAKKSAKGSR